MPKHFSIVSLKIRSWAKNDTRTHVQNTYNFSREKSQWFCSVQVQVVFQVYYTPLVYTCWIHSSDLVNVREYALFFFFFYFFFLFRVYVNTWLHWFACVRFVPIYGLETMQKRIPLIHNSATGQSDGIHTYLCRILLLLPLPLPLPLLPLLLSELISKHFICCFWISIFFRCLYSQLGLCPMIDFVSFDVDRQNKRNALHWDIILTSIRIANNAKPSIYNQIIWEILNALTFDFCLAAFITEVYCPIIGCFYINSNSLNHEIA